MSRYDIHFDRLQITGKNVEHARQSFVSVAIFTNAVQATDKCGNCQEGMDGREGDHRSNHSWNSIHTNFHIDSRENPVKLKKIKIDHTDERLFGL
jgi:hypothetical protein